MLWIYVPFKLHEGKNEQKSNHFLDCLGNTPETFCQEAVCVLLAVLWATRTPHGQVVLQRLHWPTSSLLYCEWGRLRLFQAMAPEIYVTHYTSLPLVSHLFAPFPALIPSFFLTQLPLPFPISIPHPLLSFTAQLPSFYLPLTTFPLPFFHPIPVSCSIVVTLYLFLFICVMHAFGMRQHAEFGFWLVLAAPCGDESH